MLFLKMIGKNAQFFYNFSQLASFYAEKTKQDLISRLKMLLSPGKSKKEPSGFIVEEEGTWVNRFRNHSTVSLPLTSVTLEPKAQYDKI